MKAVRGKARQVVLEFMGGLDTLACTVGIMGEIQLLEKLESETIEHTFSVNVEPANPNHPLEGYSGYNPYFCRHRSVSI